MNSAKCPACTNIISLEDKTRENDLVSCPHCDSLLEFISRYPPTLDWAEDPMVYPTRRVMR